MPLQVGKCSICGEVRELYPRPTGAICFACGDSEYWAKKARESEVSGYLGHKKSDKELKRLLKIHE